jgi:hypothetical protein
MQYVDIKIYLGNAFKASASYSVICNTSNPTHNTINTMTSTLSTRLYDQACIAAQKANTMRFNTRTRSLSVPDELHWYNNNTQWESLDRKEFRSLMLRMETITAEFYNDYGECLYPERSAAIKKFWADEWGCEYLPASGRWLNLYTNETIESETEKKAKRDAKKAKKEAKKAKKEAKKETNVAQYNDEEEELYVQAAQQQQQQQQQAYDDWYDAEEEAYAEAYAKAREAEELREQQEQQEAEAYLAQQEAEAYLAQQNTRITCQPVLYLEELTDVQGDPDWRAYIYYDDRIRRFVIKGTRRSLRNTGKKTRYPEMKLCFRSHRDLASYLVSSTETVNISMFAMASATVKDATFAELYALPVRGYKTELFGYDDTRPCYSTFADYLRMLRDVDASHSNFVSF